jgi:outer membrane protein OmpA-like peptidoglycan-associated protein
MRAWNLPPLPENFLSEGRPVQGRINKTEDGFMKKGKHQSISSAPMAVAFLFACVAAVARTIAADVDPPVMEHIEDTTDITVVAPTNTWYGTRGLSQTPSAEALGKGRLVLGLFGPWYRQQRTFQGAPNADADIFTGRASVAIGFNRQVDGFASLSFYGSDNYTSDRASGLGTFGGGLQGTLPFTPSAPIRMGAQLAVFQGLSDNSVNSNFADGYNYFETRTGLDFHAKLLQTLVFGKEQSGLKLHLNQGVVTSMESGTEPLLLLAAGMQVNLPVTILGLELNSRTLLKDISPATDPLWLSPSLQFRTGYNLNFSIGGDVSLSKERSVAAQRALEPYRLFGGLAFTFDTEAETRRQEKAEAWRRAEERRKLNEKNRALAQEALEDSLAASAASYRTDSLARFARQDSLDRAEKAKQDSLALVESRKKLAEERAKRTDLENQLLTTGVLVMDAVYFETGKTAISLNSNPYLDMLAKMLTKYPKLQIEVAGHTDNVGSDAYNMKLSEGRSAAVVAYMVGKEPTLSGRLVSKGYGETKPKADNSTAEGRMRNRRTELQVLNKDALQEYNEPEAQARAPEQEDE